MKLSNLQKELLNLLQIWAVAMIIAWGVDPEFGVYYRSWAFLLSFLIWFCTILWKCFIGKYD